MSNYVIHILLLDGKVICKEYEGFTTEYLTKHICQRLRLDRPDTVGLLYKDSRGSLRWLEESKLIVDHDLEIDKENIQLLFKIRHVPHHLCYNQSNIYQLFLLSSRLLRQDWFILQPEIHSQLSALFVLFKQGRELNKTEIEDFVQKSNILLYDSHSKTNLLPTVINAYSNYRDKFEDPIDFFFKFLHLALSFSIVNSKLFIVSNAKKQKFVLGVNSLQLTLFNLDQFQTPFARFKYSDIENVMHRDLKIIIDVKYSKKRSLTPSRFAETDMTIFYGLTPHQSSCIYSEIQASWKYFSHCSTSIYKINSLMSNNNFKQSVIEWLETNIEDNTEIFSDEDSNFDIDSREDFEKSFFESDLYQRIYQTPNNISDTAIRLDLTQLLVEESQLKDLLYQKMIQLQESFAEEEKITGILPPEAHQYFSIGMPKFQRNAKLAASNLLQHRGCAASVRTKFMDIGSQQGTIKYINESLPASRSVTDLNTMKSNSQWKAKCESNSLRSYQGKKDTKINKSSTDLCDGDQFEYSQIVGQSDAKSQSQSYNSPHLPNRGSRPRGRIYNSVSDNKYSPSFNNNGSLYPSSPLINYKSSRRS